MSVFKVNEQTDAKDDDFLFECFHDSGVVNRLLTGGYSIIAGRTGSGKTAIARYLEKKGDIYDIGFSHRISIRNWSSTQNEPEKSRTDSLLIFIVIRTIEKLLEEDVIENKSFWRDFFTQNGIQPTSDYQSFIESQKGKEKTFSIKGTISAWFSKAEGSASLNQTSTSERTVISRSPTYLYEQLRQCLPTKYKILIFVDDLSDYLDRSTSDELHTDLNVIREVLLFLSEANALFKDAEKDLKFVTLFREDLFSVMEGSSVNKLKSSSLKLVWNENDFASLLIKRLPFFADNLAQALKNPIDSIRQQFPDEIFVDELKKFETRKYSTNFYTYIMAISFNRPRDFLSFCYAMRNRLSTKKQVEFSNIEAAEIEYSDYFRGELRDELSLASRILGYDADQDHINQLIDVLCSDKGMGASELRTKLSQYLGEKTSLGKKKIQFFIEEMWRYGVLGIIKRPDKAIKFNYMPETIDFSTEQVKEYTFFLHRGLWWFVKKYKRSAKKNHGT
jgi:hypothetical protein